MTTDNKPQIKMNLVWWAANVTEESFYTHRFIKILNQKYNILYSQKPDYVIVDIFNEYYSAVHRTQIEKNLSDYDCVRIFCTGENVRADYNLVDYAIDYDFVDFGDRHLRVPLFVLFPLENSEAHRTDKRGKFCSYMVSHSGATEWGAKGGLRDRFFDRLSEYKRVDSGGSWRNNIGGTIDNHYKDDWVANKRKWLRNYKFNICFENSSYPGYLTEKLFDAYNAGCVPIYWGDTTLRVGAESAKNHKGGGNCTYNPHDLDSIDMRIPQISPHLLEYKINPKAFINAHNFPNLDALVEEVKRIDNDDKAYNAMRNEPLFLDNFDPKTFYEKKVLEFFDNIFSQSPNLAFRRGEGQHLYNYRNRIANISKYGDKMGLIYKFSDCEDLGKDAINLAKFYDKIRKFTRKFRHTLKFWKR